MDIKNLSMDSKCVHAGHKPNPEGALVTPIYQVSTFRFQDCDHGARLFKGEEDGYIYTRMRNPTVEAMEDAVAALENGAKALGCASGMAAVHTLFAATLKQGDHVVASESLYGPSLTILRDFFSGYGITADFVDSSDLDAVKNAIKPNTKMIYIETPGNPTLVVSDIAAIAEIAKENNIKVAVDNTFLSPIYQRPLDLGADYVLHSMTKFLNGHADVVAGIVVVKDAAEYPKFRKVLNLTGGIIDPFNSFLVHRGLRTLSLRVERQTENAMKVAEFLENHPKIEWVAYPGLKSHPQHDISCKQASGFGSLLAVELKGGYESGKRMLNNIELFALAVSLGGVESLIQHPASMTHATMGAEARKAAKITDGLIRVAIGIENIEDIIKALDKALSFA